MFWLPTIEQLRGPAVTTAQRQQFEQHATDQAADDAAPVLAGSAQRVVERFAGHGLVEHHIHAEQPAVEAERPVHVGDADDQV
jgi:fructose-1-phosphate kinase PfkB-like protein